MTINNNQYKLNINTFITNFVEPVLIAITLISAIIASILIK